MADIYVRFTDGNDADNGSTWALAKASAVGAAAIDVAGDRVFFSSTHDETIAANTTLAFAGTAASPTQLISANDAAEPPTTATPGASVRISGANSVTITGAVHGYGLTFQSGGGSGAGVNFQGVQLYEVCNFLVEGNTGNLGIGNAANGKNYVRLRDCNVKITVAGSRIDIQHGCIFTWDGGSLLSGSLCTSLFSHNGVGNTRGGTVLVSGVDLSNGPTAMNIVQSTGAGNATFKLRNCKMPAGWTGSPVQSGSAEPALRVELWNCSAGSDNISYWMQEPLCGEVRSNAAVYTADFGTGTPHSLRFSSVSTTNRATRLVGPDFFEAASTGSVTASVEIVTDNLTLTDADIWLEVMSMSSSGTPLGTWVSDKVSTPLATASDQASSSTTWVTTGLTTPVRQVLSVSVNPAIAGYLVGRVVLARASTTVFVEPRLRVA